MKKEMFYALLDKANTTLSDFSEDVVTVKVSKEQIKGFNIEANLPFDDLFHCVEVFVNGKSTNTFRQVVNNNIEEDKDLESLFEGIIIAWILSGFTTNHIF